MMQVDRCSSSATRGKEQVARGRGRGLDAGCVVVGLMRDVATRWGELYEGRLVIVMSFEEDRRHVTGTKWLGGRYGVS